jgi:hypothetical protein
MPKIKIIQEIEVKYLMVEATVRYWEDTEVNGIIDYKGDLIPLRQNDTWCPLIELETGKLPDWPIGTTAKIHYKVCDEGIYKLTDKDLIIIKQIEGYVPNILCPKDRSYGDYIIMDINENGIIQNWKVDLTEFEDE